MKSAQIIEIFKESIRDYHQKDHVDTPIQNPKAANSFEATLYHKNWIDTVQWHLEDIIREPSIAPDYAVEIKRRIDSSNQERTDMVEAIDDYIFEQFKAIEPKADARINTETPAWAIDRLSILMLKIYHMREEAERADASDMHRAKCAHKYAVLKQQLADLGLAIDQLISDIEQGDRIVKTYKQMKMYNDAEMNPVLRKQS